MEQKDQNIQSKENIKATLTHFSIEYLKSTAPWLKFLSILGFIFSALLLFVAFFSLGAAGITKEVSGTVSNSVVSFILYLVIAIITFFASKYLFNYAGKIKAFTTTNDSVMLEAAFLMQKKFWKLIGIIFIIYLSLLLIALIAFALGALFMI